MEHKVVQMLGGMLLAYNLKVALLQPLEVVSHEPGQEIKTVLNGLDLSHDKLYYLQWIPLLVDLLNYM